jgi:glycosyltransferase involved in cell wall biosynthesis
LPATPAPKLLYLVTEDWYVLSHRLPMARAARDAGFAVTVATRVADGAAAIHAEGFALEPLAWQRGIASPVEIARSVGSVARVLRRLRPDIVHNVALKPILIAGLARRLAPRAQHVNAVTGLGSTMIETGGRPRLSGRAVRAALPRMLNARDAVTVIQNDNDAEALAGLGADRARMVRIRGSGVDLAHHMVLPEPDGPVTVGIAARMLDDKGIRPLIEAIRRVRAAGEDVRLLLAGDTDAENPTAIPRSELEALAGEPGITWLGHVADVRSLWARCHIAALPSRREGLPKSLLEAAAAGRPLIATDVPGCREVAIAGVNALLVPVDDAAALAEAIGTLAADAARRRTLGAASRRMVESDLSAEAVAGATVALYRRLLAER